MVYRSKTNQWTRSKRFIFSHGFENFSVRFNSMLCAIMSFLCTLLSHTREFSWPLLLSIIGFADFLGLAELGLTAEYSSYHVKNWYGSCTTFSISILQRTKGAHLKKTQYLIFSCALVKYLSLLFLKFLESNNLLTDNI